MRVISVCVSACVCMYVHAYAWILLQFTSCFSFSTRISDIFILLQKVGLTHSNKELECLPLKVVNCIFLAGLVKDWWLFLPFVPGQSWNNLYHIFVSTINLNYAFSSLPASYRDFTFYGVIFIGSTTCNVTQYCLYKVF